MEDFSGKSSGKGSDNGKGSDMEDFSAMPSDKGSDSGKGSDMENSSSKVSKSESELIELFSDKKPSSSRNFLSFSAGRPSPPVSGGANSFICWSRKSCFKSW